MARTEEEIIGGYITVGYGDEARRLPTLKIVDSRAWKKLVSDRFGPEFIAAANGGDGNQMTALQGVDALATTALLDLIVAYDKGKVLGGRREIERTLDDQQMLALYTTLMQVTFPFALELIPLMTRILSSPAAPSTGASSPSSPLPNGASGLTVSPPN